MVTRAAVPKVMVPDPETLDQTVLARPDPESEAEPDCVNKTLLSLSDPALTAGRVLSNATDEASVVAVAVVPSFPAKSEKDRLNATGASVSEDCIS